MGAVIRKACEADAEQVGAVQYRAWMETYTGLLPEKFLAGQSMEKEPLPFGKVNAIILLLLRLTGKMCTLWKWSSKTDDSG